MMTWGGLAQSVTYNVTYEWVGLPSAQTLFDEDHIGLEGDNKPKPPDSITGLESGNSYTVDSSQPGMVVYTQDGPGNRTAKYTLGDWKNSSGQSVTGQQTMGDSDVTLKATWTKEEIPVQMWDVTYSWNFVADEGVAIPEGTIRPDTETLPSAFQIANNDTLEYCGKADTKYTAGYAIITDADADYGYVFSGWDITTGCITEKTDITGTWTYGPIKHTATYQWKWLLPTGVEIEDVQLYDKAGNPMDTPTLPATVEGLVKGQVLNLDTTWTFETVYTHDEYDNIIGMYSLERWQQSDRYSDTYTMPGEDVVLTTIWMPGPVAPVPKNLVQYDWGWENVPDGVNFPRDDNWYKKGQSYTVLAAPANVEYRDENDNLLGTYVFSGWKNEAGEIVSGQQQIMGETSPRLTGTWTYVKPFALEVSGENQEPIEYYNYKAEKDLGTVTMSNTTGSASGVAVKMDCVIDPKDSITRVQLGLPKTDDAAATIANITSVNWTYEDDDTTYTWSQGDTGQTPWTDAYDNCVIMNAPAGKTFASISITVAEWNASDATASTSFYGTQKEANRTDFSKHTVTLTEADEEGNFIKNLGSATAGGKMKQQTSMDVTPSVAGSETNAGSMGNIDIKLYATQKSGAVYSKGCVALILPNGITPTLAQQYYDLNEWHLSIAPAATLRTSRAATADEIAASGIKGYMDASDLTEATVWIYDLDQNATSARTSSESSIHLKVNYTVDSLMPAFSAPFSSMVYAGTNLSGVTSTGGNVVDDPFGFTANGKAWSCTTGTTLTIDSPAQVSVSNAVKKADGTYVTYDPNNADNTTAVLGGDVTGEYKVTVTSTVDTTDSNSTDNYIFIPVPKEGGRLKGLNESGKGIELIDGAGFSVTLAGTPSTDSNPSVSIEYRYLKVGYIFLSGASAEGYFESGSTTASEDTNLIAVKVSGQTKGSQFTITVPFTTPAYEQLETVYTQFQAISVYVSTGSSYASYTASDGTGTMMLGFTNIVRNITFNLEGGTSAGGTDATTVSDGRMATEPAAPTKDKCDFVGWYTSEADAEAAVAADAFDFANTPITADTMFYAGWKAGTYSLTYDLDGGVAPTTPNPTTYTYGESVDSFDAPTKVGNTFLGWYDTEGYDTEGEPLGHRVATIATDDWGDKTLYAKWSLKSYTLSFDRQLNGSAGDIVDPQQVKYGGHPSNIGEPRRDGGFTFDGWYTEAECAGTRVDLGTYVMPASDTTLYAKWDPITYTAEFDVGLASYTTGISFTGIDTQTGLAFGSNLTNDITMTRSNEDYSFDGWSWKYNDWSGNTYTGITDLNGHKNIPIEGYITFTPIISNKSAYTLSASTGGKASASITVAGAEKDSLSNVTTPQSVIFSQSANAGDYKTTRTITMTSTASASDAHYKLAGVTLSDAYGNKQDLSFARSGTFYAGPTASYGVAYTYKNNGDLSLVVTASGLIFEKYLEGLTSLNVNYNFTEDPKADVHFKDLDGTTDLSVNTGKYAGDTVGDAPVAPTKDHYTFKEWNTAADATGTAWSATLAVTDAQAKAGTVDFYPIYTLNTHDVTFDVQGHGAAPDALAGMKFGTAFAKPTTDPTAAGYTFGGWYKTTDCIDPAWDFATDTMPDTDLTLFAKWTENANVTVSYVAQTGGSVSRPSEDVAPATGKPAGSVATAAAGYDFVGWYDATTKVSDAAEYVPAKNSEGIYETKTYTARFAEKGTVGIVYVAQMGGSVSSARDDVLPATGTAQGSVAIPDAGYHFVNWTNGVDATITTDATLTAAQVDAVAKASGIYVATTFTANFAPNTDTPYKVEHFLQSADGSYPDTPADTDNMTGTTATDTAAAAKTYADYTAGTVTQKAIAGDGSTVVRIEYARNTYSATFDANGQGTAPGSIADVRFGDTFAAPAAPIVAGYALSGWYRDAACTGQAWNFDTDTMPVGGVTLYAKWQQVIPVVEDLSMSVVYSGNNAPNTTFTFRLFAKSNTAGLGVMPMPAGGTDQTMTVTATGQTTVEFGAITFSLPGTYVYQLEQVSDAQTNWDRSTDVYTITYVVTQDGTTLKSARTITDANDVEQTAASFTNTYAEPNASSGNQPSRTELLARTGDTAASRAALAVLACAAALAGLCLACRRRRHDR